MGRRLLFAASLTGLLAAFVGVASCGARSGLFVGAPGIGESGGSGGAGTGGAPSFPDAGPDAPPDAPPDTPVVNCVEAGVTFVYLVTESNQLLAFYPPTLGFSLIGDIACPATMQGAEPFSMGVDRAGIAYVVFDDGELFRVSTANASCEATPFVPDQDGFVRFGMGFSSDQGDPGEQLYVADIAVGFASPSLGLATIDTQTFKLNFIGTFSQNPGNALEMTGTGDGRLFGYFLDNPGPGGHVVEIDKTTAAILSSTPVAAGNKNSALAFAFWGGDFYIFTTGTDGMSTIVTQYDPATGSAQQVASTDSIVVGAGVSTCAPAD